MRGSSFQLFQVRRDYVEGQIVSVEAMGFIVAQRLLMVGSCEL